MCLLKIAMRCIHRNSVHSSEFVGNLPGFYIFVFFCNLRKNVSCKSYKRYYAKNKLLHTLNFGRLMRKTTVFKPIPKCLQRYKKYNAE